MEATQTIPEWRATADEIWAIVRENARGLKELRESQKETDKLFKETREQIKETDKQMKLTDKRIGELGNRFGDIVEYMIVPNLVERFRELGFEFTRTHRDTEIVDRKHDIVLEVDAFLENGEKVIIVEIKSKPNTRDIDDHVERMEKLRKYADLHNDTRKYLGAVAGVIFNEGEKTYALKQGFYVIEPSGDTFSITEPTGKYRPREW
ncbi:MAG: hypothetical protein LBC46_06835 [Treponema sp.]|nr:hypothetical protein [Treponema sp.]